MDQIKANASDTDTIDDMVDNRTHRGTTGERLKRKLARITPDDARHVRTLKKLLDTKTPLQEIQKTESFLHCKRTLTPMQQKYLDGLLAGKFMGAAYREAYNIGVERTDKSVFNDAWKLADHPVIVLELKIAAMAKRDSKIMSAHQIREHVLTGLIRESADVTSPSASRIRALELLGKVAEVGMFITRSEVTHTHADPDDMRKQLVNKLHAFFKMNASDVTDVTAIENKQCAVTEQTFDAIERQKALDDSTLPKP